VATRGEAYEARLEALARNGTYLHGEADLLTSLLGGLAGRRILDAGCGTGRVGIELARRGASVWGVDRDPEMLAVAQSIAPGLSWQVADLADPLLRLPPADIALLAGNVLLFVTPGTEAPVVGTLAGTLVPGGRLVAGFQLTGQLTLAEYDLWCEQAGLLLEHRWSTWERDVFEDNTDYAVSVHLHP
jgi:SAM-dependent methyltransferase